MDAAAGPYNVSVWTQAAVPTVGAVHFTVAVTDPETQRPLLYHEVAVRMTSPADAELVLAGYATHDFAVNKLYYEVDLDVPAPGMWDVTVSVAGPAGEGAARFTLPVEGARPLDFTAWGAAALGVLLVGALIATTLRRAVRNRGVR